jgi:hypothetical protein
VADFSALLLSLCRTRTKCEKRLKLKNGNRGSRSRELLRKSVKQQSARLVSAMKRKEKVGRTVFSGDKLFMF